MSTKPRMIVLKSSDNEIFELEETAARESVTITHLIEAVSDESDSAAVIPLPNVTGQILSKVVEFCKRHVNGHQSDEDLKKFDVDFVKVDQGTLFDIILAANYLEIKKLLDITCQAVADMIKGKSPEEIRKMFHIENDFTPEEEEEIRRENAWAYQ